MLIKSPIIYKGNEYIDNPDFVELQIDSMDKARILDLQLFIGRNPHVSQIRMDTCVNSFSDENGEDVEFATDVDYLIVFKNAVYYYGQHKHDASAQIESNDMQDIIFSPNETS